MNAEPIIDRFRVLDPDEQLVLIDQLWAEFAGSANDLPLFDWQKAALDRRVRDAAENPEDLESWDAVRTEGRDRLTQAR